MRLAKITIATLATAALIWASIIVFSSGVAGQKIDFQPTKLQSTEQKLNDLNIQYDKLNGQYKETSSSDKAKAAELQKLEKEREELRKQLQSKAEAKEKLAKAAEEAANKITATQTASAAPLYVLPAGSHTDWMAQAGIDPANYGYVDYIVSHESGWNPCSYNPGKSNCNLTAEEIGYHACGLGQQLPCGKWAGAWNDPIAALKAMNIYVNKFGGWAGAYAYWLAHGNY